MNLAGNDPEHVFVVPGGLLAPTAKAGLMAAIVGDEIAGGGAMAHPTVILAEGHRQVVRLKPRRYAQPGLGTLKIMPEQQRR